MQNKLDDMLVERSIPEAQNVKFHAEGGFKAVYKAEINHEIEALKVIYLPEKSDQPEARAEIGARIKREVESLARLSSPYVVKLGSLSPRICRIGDHDYIIYSEELLNGPSLADRLRAGHKPGFGKCLSLFVCLLKVVSELKSENLIHRDIKPGNIIEVGLDERPFVLLDLGVAFKLDSTAITSNPEYRHGTLPYMAPEMFAPRFRELMDFRSDLYSAAVTLYEYAAGTHPVARSNENDQNTIYRITRVKPLPFRMHRQDFPVGFCDLIDKLIRKKPALRPSNIEALLEQLERLS